MPKKQSPKPTEPESNLITIAAPGDENKKRFKVGLTYVGTKLWTVYADSAEQAAHLVSNGAGRNAGQEEERQVAVQAKEMKDGEKPPSFTNMFLAMIHHMQQQVSRQNSGGMIERPSGIVVPEFVPPKDIVKG